MYRSIKFLFLATALISLSNCEEEERIVARKKPGSDINTTMYYIGSFASVSPSQSGCPSGPGAKITIDFSEANASFDIDIPVRDTLGNASNILESANNNKSLIGTPVLNNQTGEFSATYLIDDSNGDFDITTCDGAPGGYSGSSQLSVIGAVSGTTSSTNYSIVNICTNGSVAGDVCVGSMDGFASNN